MGFESPASTGGEKSEANTGVDAQLQPAQPAHAAHGIRDDRLPVRWNYHVQLNSRESAGKITEVKMTDAELIFQLEQLLRLREERKELVREEHTTQDRALPMIRKEDPGRDGVEITVDGIRFRAKWQQNEAPEDWDLENLIPYLKKKGIWSRVSTEILDQAKLDAEIRAGNVSLRELRGFKLKGNRPAAFIRFDEIKRRIVIRRKRRR